jgi:DNA-binding Xre family transcriptional regulator
MSETVFLLDHEQNLAKHFAALHPKILRSQDEIREAFGTQWRHALWIAPGASSMHHFASLRGSRNGDQRLLLLGRVEGARRELLHALFRFVVALDNGVKLLPAEEIAEVFASSHREDLFIGGAVDQTDRALVLYRGNLESLVVPLSWFARPGGPRADHEDFEVTDFGQTVRLGKFEAAADAILNEFDPEARRRAKQRSIANDTSLGGALRRLRIQRGLRRDGFAGISAKEIARIERGEVAKPHTETLAKLAQRLGVKPEEIETY